MADRRISQLTSADTLVENDILPFTDISATETKRISAENLGLALVEFGTSRGSDAPTSPANGQLWVDTSNNPPELKIYNGATFSLVSFLPTSAVITNPGGSEPSSPSLGQLWQDTSTTPDELKMYDGSNWVRVDPQGITQTAGDARYLQITTASSTYLPLAGGTLTGTLTLDAAPTADLEASTKKYVDDQIAGIDTSDPTPAGTVIYTARTTAPTGYLKANGAAVSRTTYSDLFDAIGTIYGSGDGSTTFNVPDLRGEFVRGFDDSRGVDSGRTLGSTQADATALNGLTIGSVGNHSHSYRNTASDNIAGIGDNRGYISSSGTGSSTGAAGAHNHTLSSTDTETRPRNVALLACIKT